MNLKNIKNSEYFKPVILSLASIIAVFTIGFLMIGPETEKELAVNIQKVGLQSVQGEYELSGQLAPKEIVDLSARMTGLLESIEVRDGDKVVEGQLLLALESSDLTSNLNKAQANLAAAKEKIEKTRIDYETAKEDLEKNKVLYDMGAISKDAFRDIKNRSDQAEINYKLAKEANLIAAEETLNLCMSNLEKAETRSPIEGVVVLADLAEGERIGAGANLGAVMNVDELLIKASMPEELINGLQLGDEVAIGLSALPDREFIGEITAISPTSVPSGEYFPIEISLGNQDNLLKPGMSAVASINIAEEERISLPKKAILKRDGHDFIYVLKDKKVELRQIRKGLQKGEIVEIKSGLNIGEEVVTDKVEYLYDGMQVSVADQG